MGDQCHCMASNERILQHLLAARKHKMGTYCIKYTSRYMVCWFFPLGLYGWWMPSYGIHHMDMFSAYTRGFPGVHVKCTSPVGQNLTPTGTGGIMILRSGQGFTLSQAFTDHECEIVSDFPSTKLLFFCIFLYFGLQSAFGPIHTLTWSLPLFSISFILTHGFVHYLLWVIPPPQYPLHMDLIYCCLCFQLTLYRSMLSLSFRCPPPSLCLQETAVPVPCSGTVSNSSLLAWLSALLCILAFFNVLFCVQ